jgi:hypothetical protein
MAAVTIAEPRSPGRPAGPSTRRVAPCRPAPCSPAVRRRRRLVAVGLGLVLAVGAARAAVALGGSPLAVPERPPAATPSLTPSTAGVGAGETYGDDVVSHVVEPGDTLWSIAVELAPGDDPRPVVDVLADARGDGPLVPGETIAWAP